LCGEFFFLLWLPNALKLRGKKKRRRWRRRREKGREKRREQGRKRRRRRRNGKTQVPSLSQHI
jgi:hypothetical protein